MNKKLVFLLLSIAFLAVGLVAMFGFEGTVADIVEGIAKGLAGVFFILYFIFMLLGNEPVDEGSH